MKDLKTDCVAAYYCGIQQRECFDEELAVHVVEVPVKEHGKPEVIEAKEAEIRRHLVHMKKLKMLVRTLLDRDGLSPGKKGMMVRKRNVKEE